MATMNVAGRFTLTGTQGSLAGCWHCLNSDENKNGGLIASGSLTFERASSSSSSVLIYGTIASNLRSVGGSGWSYGYKIDVALIQGGTLINVKHKHDTQNVYVVDNTGVILDSWTSDTNANNYSREIKKQDSYYLTITDNTKDIYLCYRCGQTGGCSIGYDGTSTNYHSAWVVVGTIDPNTFPYNPHTMPSVSSNPVVWSKYNTSRTMTINYNVNGDSSAHTLVATYTDKNGNIQTICTETNITSNGSKTITFTPNINRDNKYTVTYAFYVNDDSSYMASGSKELGIYGFPTLSFSQSNSIVAKGNKNTITVGTTKLNNDTSSTVTVSLSISDSGSSISDTPINAKSTGSAQSGTYEYLTQNASSWYTIVATMTHNQSGETTSKTLYGYTYTQPSVSNVSVVSTPFSPQDATKLKWKTNSRGWSGENNFKTYVTISGSNISSYEDTINNGPENASPSTSSTTSQPNANNSTSADIETSLVSGTYNVQNIFDVNARSVAQLSSTVTIKRNNSSGSLNATGTTTFVVQYQPTKKPSDDTVVNNATNVDVQGQTVAIQDVPEIKVSWKYNHNAGASGVVNGYKVEIYYDNDETKNHQTKYYNKTALSSPVSITLDTATELKRGKMNYAKVTPYYIKPNGTFTPSSPDETKIILGTQSYSFELVKPYYKMDKPVIEYPKNNTTWHNKDFRILTTIPEDPDFDSYTQSQKDNYTYGNIQVEIKLNNSSTGIIYDYTTVWSGGSREYKNCFSSLLTDYKKKKAIWLNRTDGDLATANKYTIRVRVQKAGYQYTEAEMRDNSDNSVTWSPWSDPVVLNISAVTKQNLVKGNKIMATEQNKVANYSTRLLACYPFTAKDSRNVLKEQGDIIYRAEYQGIYETIKSIITGVKNYCIYTNDGTYDRRDIQFGYGTKALPSFTAIQEIILAAETGTDDHGETGRNYKNILTGYMIDCLK